MYSPKTQVNVLAQRKWDSFWQLKKMQKMMGTATRPSQELYGSWHRQSEDIKQEIMKIKMTKFPMSKFCQITASNNIIKSTGFVAVVIGF